MARLRLARRQREGNRRIARTIGDSSHLRRKFPIWEMTHPVEYLHTLEQVPKEM